MAVDVHSSENMSTITSPRLSFSQDLEEQVQEEQEDDDLPCRLDHTLLLDKDSSPFDFAFNVDATTLFHSSTADELFSNGQILPTELKKEEEKPTNKTPPKRNPEILTPCLAPRKKSLREFLQDSIEDGEDEKEEESPSTSQGKSFWMFRRSNSLNFDKKSLAGSLKILSRSGSTGKFLEKIVEENNEAEKHINPKSSFWKFSRKSSVNSTNVNGNPKNNQFRRSSSLKYTISGANQGLNWSKDNQFRRSSSLKCTISGANHGLNGSVKKLPRSKSTGSAPNQVGNNAKMEKSASQKREISNMKIYGYGNGSCNKSRVRVSPVMNMPSPYISRVSVDLLGFGSLFCNGSVKDRKKKC